MASSATATPHDTSERQFWRDVFVWRGSSSPKVLPRALACGLYGLLIGLVHEIYGWEQLGAVPAQFTGAILVLLLVLRTNAGYERWWEARKLWGGIVNQSRNLTIAGLSYGPDDPGWRASFVRWSAAFCHAARCSLRGERQLPALARLLGEEETGRVRTAQHMPTAVALRLAALLREAVDRGALDRVAFLAVDRERAQLIDHVGGCERILKTPLPPIHTITLRRFIVLYLIWLPLAAVGEPWWLPGLVTGLVAYPMFEVDQIAVELENPFSAQNLSYLPLDDICATIERDLLAADQRAEGAAGSLRPELPAP